MSVTPAPPSARRVGRRPVTSRSEIEHIALDLFPAFRVIRPV
jgi:hypothetical protein